MNIIFNSITPNNAKQILFSIPQEKHKIYDPFSGSIKKKSFKFF